MWHKFSITSKIFLEQKTGTDKQIHWTILSHNSQSEREFFLSVFIKMYSNFVRWMRKENIFSVRIPFNVEKHATIFKMFEIHSETKTKNAYNMCALSTRISSLWNWTWKNAHVPWNKLIVSHYKSASTNRYRIARIHIYIYTHIITPNAL